jgi:pimeloyl-ACP methyl ester carboxylesterase
MNSQRGRSPSPTSVIRLPFSLSVRPNITSGPEWQICGDLYQSLGPAPRVVQVLIPGLTYDRRYWAMPGEYNFAEYMARAGYATLTFDRIGTGRSTHPAAREVTADAHVATLHQLVQALRAGQIADQPFDRVVTVGHSYGSGLAIMESSRHADIDGLIVTGMLHAFTELYDEVRGFFHPAAQDPILGPGSPPSGYMTQRPSYRSVMLEHTPNVDPQMSQYNELIKSTGTLGEGDTLPQTYLPNYSIGVQVPVLLVVGQYDALYCGKAVRYGHDSESVHIYERAFFSPEARLETHVIPDAGHSLNLHRNARTWFAIAEKWVKRRVPPLPPRVTEMAEGGA